MLAAWIYLLYICIWSFIFELYAHVMYIYLIVLQYLGHMLVMDANIMICLAMQDQVIRILGTPGRKRLTKRIACGQEVKMRVTLRRVKVV